MDATPPPEKPSTYTARSKKFYETHKAEIHAKRQEKKGWLEFYQRNKERLKAKRREIYQIQKAAKAAAKATEAATPL